MNTTIGVVATDAVLDHGAVQRLAAMAQGGFAYACHRLRCCKKRFCLLGRVVQEKGSFSVRANPGWPSGSSRSIRRTRRRSYKCTK